MRPLMDALPALLGASAKLVELRKSVAQLLSGHREGRRLPPVLIQGETGTGKGLLASAMHRASARASAEFVDVNCAAIPEHLLEAEMFGFERDAFTGARHAKPGLFQVAHRGTIFLDEIGLLSTGFQAKLLKALEDKSVRRLGATRAEPADAWVICATNEDLAAAVSERRFRADLYHRVCVVTLVLPPLREREGDILLLAKHFAERARADYGLGPVTITGDAEAALTAYWWPGNVRELSNIIERAVLLADTQTLTAAHLDLPPGPTGGEPASVAAPAMPLPTGAATSREHLERVLTETGWNITRAAAVLGIARNTMKSRMARLGLREPSPAATLGSGTTIASIPTPIRAEAAPAVHWEPKRVTFFRLQVPTVGGVLDARPARLFELATDKLRSFGGRITGLGPATVLAVFGVERSDEPAVLAGHAALVIQKSARHLRHDTGNTMLHATIGLHVAEVLVSRGAIEADVDADGSRREWIALETAMANAGVDEIVATKAAATFLHRRFAVSAVGPGSALYRLDGLARLDTAATHGSELVGRRGELDAVARAMRSALDGAGGVVSLVGDAGIGKSRLLADLAAHADLGGARFVEGRCLPATTQTPFWPVMQIVRSICRITEDDPEAFAKAKISRTLDAIGLDDAVIAVDLARLLSSTTAPADVAAGALSRRLFAAVEQLLTAVAAARARGGRDIPARLSADVGEPAARDPGHAVAARVGRQPDAHSPTARRRAVGGGRRAADRRASRGQSALCRGARAGRGGARRRLVACAHPRDDRGSDRVAFLRAARAPAAPPRARLRHRTRLLRATAAGDRRRRRRGITRGSPPRRARRLRLRVRRRRGRSALHVQARARAGDSVRRARARGTTRPPRPRARCARAVASRPARRPGGTARVPRGAWRRTGARDPVPRPGGAESERAVRARRGARPFRHRARHAPRAAARTRPRPTRARAVAVAGGRAPRHPGLRRARSRRRVPARRRALRGPRRRGAAPADAERRVLVPPAARRIRRGRRRRDTAARARGAAAGSDVRDDRPPRGRCRPLPHRTARRRPHVARSRARAVRRDGACGPGGALRHGPRAGDVMFPRACRVDSRRRDARTRAARMGRRPRRADRARAQHRPGAIVPGHLPYCRARTRHCPAGCRAADLAIRARVAHRARVFRSLLPRRGAPATHYRHDRGDARGGGRVVDNRHRRLSAVRRGRRRRGARRRRRRRPRPRCDRRRARAPRGVERAVDRARSAPRARHPARRRSRPCRRRRVLPVPR